MCNFMEEYFRTVLEHSKAIQTANEELTKATLIAIGYQRGVEEAKAAPPFDNGIHIADTSRDPVQEVEDMLLKLNISGSIRQRPSGLLEFRNPYLGSVYGHSAEEICKKID